MSKQQLEHFVKRSLEGRGDIIYAKQMYEDYRIRFGMTVKELEINEKTFASNLQKITKKLFENQSINYGYVLSLLIFCVELDKHCKTIHIEWYTTMKLIDILVEILFDYNYTPPKYSYYNICNIIYFVHFLCFAFCVPCFGIQIHVEPGGGWGCLDLIPLNLYNE